MDPYGSVWTRMGPYGPWGLPGASWGLLGLPGAKKGGFQFLGGGGVPPWALCVWILTYITPAAGY